MGLGIDWHYLLIMLINFGILFGLLFFVAYKPILRMIDERSARIKESMDLAELNKEKAAKAEEEIKGQLEEARKEGQSVIAQATQIGERVKEEAKLGAKEEVEVMLKRARGEIQRERDEAMDELRKEFIDIAMLAAEKVINESLDKEKHRRLIEETLEESTTLKKGQEN